MIAICRAALRLPGLQMNIKGRQIRRNASQLSKIMNLNSLFCLSQDLYGISGIVPFTFVPLLPVHLSAVNVPGWLNRHHPGNPGSRQRKSPLRGALSLFLTAFGSGAILHPCRSPPLGASLRLDPASRKRFGDFQPDSRSLNLLSRLNVAPVLGPRRNRRTGGQMTRAGRQGWRPEAKRDRTKLPGAILNSACAGPEGASPMDGTSNHESSRPQAAGRKVSAVRSTDFMAGRGDCKGGRVAPFARSQVVTRLYSAEHKVNGTTSDA